jgi:aminopeptidase N
MLYDRYMTKSIKRLFEGFQPENYNLTINPDRTTMTFTGSVTITGRKVGRPSERLTFHQVDLQAQSATIVKHDKKGDQEYIVSRINNQDSLQEMRLHTDETLYPGNYTVTIQFSGKIPRSMTGLYPCYFKNDGKDDFLLATQFESHHAREVFPCIDEPEAKATFDLTVSHEKDLVALGNMPVKSAVPSEAREGYTETTFDTSPIMSTYLLAFVIGDMHKVSGQTKSGVEVNIWSPVSQPKEALTFALDVAIRSTEFFEDYFGVAFPLPKSDLVGLPDFAVGAMENWGLMTYREACLYVYPDAPSQSTKETVALVVSHEVSHQWFGNLVTMKWWNDLWLNESFANIMEYEAVDTLFPDWHIWNSFVTSEGLQAYRRDATPGVQAVKTDVNHPDEINSIVDPSIVYAKGGRLLYMLKNYIGEDAWRKGLTEYFKTHAYKNTVGADLWQSLSKASGKDIATFMNPWLERSGYPVITIDQTKDSAHITQQHFLDNQEKVDPTRVWPVPLFATDEAVPKLLDVASTETTLSTPEFIHINDAAKGHFITRYSSPEHRAYLKEQVEQKQLDTIDRLMLLSNSSMLGRAGYESFGETLQLLSAYTDETEEAVWDIMSLVVADTRRFVSADESLEPAIKKLVGKLVKTERTRLGWEEQPTDSPADQKLRATVIALSAYAEDEDTVAKALELYDGYKANPSIVSAELRGIVFTVAVKEQYKDVMAYLQNLYTETNNSDLQRDISGALTATRLPEQALGLLEFIKNPDDVKPQDADYWMVYLLRNRYCHDVTWQWMEDNWDTWIEEVYGKDKTYDMFPRYAASSCSTPKQLERYTAFFEAKKDQPALRRNIEIGIEEINNRVAWLQRDLKAVQDFFS